MLADGRIDTLQYAVEWKSEASGKRFDPDSTGPEIGIRRATHEGELQI